MAVALAGVSSASATLTEVYDSVSPGEVVNVTEPYYSGGAWAGIYNLTVDGVATPSFCIDIARESGTADNYYYTPLASAPLAPVGPMGATVATDIEKLWAAYFPSASADMSGLNAAALQVAIWEDIATSVGTSLTVSGNVPVTTEAASMLASLPGLNLEAGLQGLASPTTQNYVVPVPEPTTMIAGALLLLPFGASTLRILRKNRTA